MLYAHEIKKNLVILDMFFIPKKFYSYGVHIITKQPLYLINSLLESLHNDTTCKDNEIRKFLLKRPLSCKGAIKMVLN